MSQVTVSQQQFIKVKERLDGLRLSHQFPVEATPLVQSLLDLITNKDYHVPINNVNYSAPTSALKHETARLVKQNNRLHMQVISLKQQVQSLAHCLQKRQLNSFPKESQIIMMTNQYKSYQQKLKYQFEQLRFKYNQLIDLLHQDKFKDREYIKRLMKYKYAEESNVGQFPERKQKSNIVQSSEIQEKVRFLQKKVRNRQNQILRLQKVLQYDGLNMNKLINNYQEHIHRQELSNAEHKINILQKNCKQFKNQNRSMKNKNGSKQALRIEVENCHKIIQELKQNNKKLKEELRQANFDCSKKNDVQKAKAFTAETKLSQQIKQNKQFLLKYNQLQKKIQFLPEQIQKERKSKMLQQNQIKKLNQEKKKLQNQLQRSSMMRQYQITSYKVQFEDYQMKNKQLNSKINLLLSQQDISKRKQIVLNASIQNLQKIVTQILSKQKQGQSILVKSLQEARLKIQNLHIQSLQLKRQLSNKTEQKNIYEHKSNLLQIENNQLKNNQETLMNYQKEILPIAHLENLQKMKINYF